MSVVLEPMDLPGGLVYMAMSQGRRGDLVVGVDPVKWPEFFAQTGVHEGCRILNGLLAEAEKHPGEPQYGYLRVVA